jgi:hypothetical protein
MAKSPLTGQESPCLSSTIPRNKETGLPAELLTVLSP